MWLPDTIPVPGPDVTMNLGDSMLTFTAVHFSSPSLQPPNPAHWEKCSLPLKASACPQEDTPLVLSSFPRSQALLVRGVQDSGSSRAGVGKVIVQVRVEGRETEHPGAKSFVSTKTSLNWNAPVAPDGATEQAPSPLEAASAVEKMALTTSLVKTQAWKRGLFPACPVPPPAVQLTSIFPKAKGQPAQHSVSAEGLATTQSRLSLDDSTCNPQSIYENYRLWQSFKPLAETHYPQSPDTEALSCFLIPVLRSLARRKPTMTLEEGIWWSLQEWQHTSNFDRMIFYEMAGKFMEFESEEEAQIRKLQLKNGSACAPPSDAQKLDSQRPSATVVDQPPSMGTQAARAVLILKERGGRAPSPDLRQQRPKCTWEPKTPKTIPPEAVKEYVDNMISLLRPAQSSTGEADNQWEGEENEHPQEEDDISPDPGLMSYINMLCSQEAFVTKVEAVIHPQFLGMLLSLDPLADPLDLIEKLEQEEGLTLTQLTEKRLLELKETKSGDAPQSHDMPQGEAIFPYSESSQGSGSGDHQDLQVGLLNDTGVDRLNADVLTREDGGNINLSKTKERAVSTWRQKSEKLQSEQSISSHRDHSHASTPSATRGALRVWKTPPVMKPPAIGEWSSDEAEEEEEEEEEEEALPSLAFLLGSQQRLLPWGHSKSAGSPSAILHNGVQGSRKAFQPLSPEKGCPSHSQQIAAKSKMPAPVRAPSSDDKRPPSAADLRGSCRQPLVVTEAKPSLPRKRKLEPSASEKRKKAYFSQYQGSLLLVSDSKVGKS
ncbi:NUT family member 2G-like [Echinops telfairi]|uniref:NUT family member 2G-like n=1 Tax=Echinops telfairi TaxID=9371 RepID=A0ABM1VK34_ECHTE|nr:NUT family member 2G-like [Echinops telfairi]